ENENVLAIQVHNTSKNSSDLTAIPFLTIGYSSQLQENMQVSDYLEMPTLYPHSNFKLSSSGETLIITHKDGMVSDSINYGVIPTNYSFGRDFNNIENWGFFTEPSPGAINGTEIASDVVKGEVKFSISNMFLTTSAYLGLSGAMPGEEIRYTENGDEPTVESSKYQYGIAIDNNKVIRARIFKDGAIPGKIASRTYLFDEKPTVPIVSISTNGENLWDNETGIYVLGDSYENKNPYYGANFWEDWEKPASVEMTGVDGNLIFALNCGIKIFGAWSRAHPQKSLSVFFRNDYGDPVLKDVPLFKSKPHLKSFKSFVLRNSGNDYGYTRFRDGFMTDLVKDMDTDIAAFEPVVLYLNGEYWGEINLREKINEDYLENNHDVDASKLDMLQSNVEILEGSNAEYLELIDFISKNSLVNDANYEVAAGQIDISNFIDYQLSQIFYNNRDWPGNNIKYWKPQIEEGKWRWILYDTDFGFGIYNSMDYRLNTISFAMEPNGPGWPNPPWSTLLLRKLMLNKTFKNSFVNRFADMLNTTFVGESVSAKIDSIAAIIQPEIGLHYQRWSTPSPGVWESAVQTMRTFAENRVSYMQTHINDELVRAGIHELALSNSPADGGKIKLNTIEIQGDSWKGKYFENVPVTLSASAFRGHKFDHWEVNGVTVLDEIIEINLRKSTTVKAVYEDEVDDGNSIVFNEINYNPSIENDAGDWVELYNWGRVDLDISGWIFRDNDDTHQFVFPENTILKSDGYLVLSRSNADFSIVHPGVFNFLGDFDFGLASAGDVVRLYDIAGELVDSVSFGSELTWPVEPNGSGPTLELRQYFIDNANSDSWKSSLENLGTPGRENSITTGADWLANVNSEKQLKIYPNPFNTETRLKIENNGFEPMRVQIFSMDGRMVRNDITFESEYVWRGDNQLGQKVQPGMYICKVQSDNTLFTGKVILSK
ncbi:MAG TPA: CotH kinase family protein, partial [Draconibacterium sp.]|nr:CotH kinase family protein [Draconibacterium sp.]